MGLFSLVTLTKNRYEERTWPYFRYAWKCSRRKETLSALKCEDYLVRIYRNNFFQCLMEYFFHRNIFSRWIINHNLRGSAQSRAGQCILPSTSSVVVYIINVSFGSDFECLFKSKVKLPCLQCFLFNNLTFIP
jgi:hypothetical protein